MQGFVFSVLRVLFGILNSAQIGFGVLGVFFGVFFWIGVILFTEYFSLSAVKVLYGLACLRAV